jgi:hypothetical protein
MRPSCGLINGAAAIILFEAKNVLHEVCCPNWTLEIQSKQPLKKKTKKKKRKEKKAKK